MFQISIASDHAGLVLKAALKDVLAAQGCTVQDHGTDTSQSVDYPDFAQIVCSSVVAGRAGFGILVCGTGIGMAIAANRVPGVRAAVLHSTTEARLTRAHNDANVACFGARTLGVELACDALVTFLATPFEGGRHAARLAKIDLAR
jgi:ribose 5-phosphate isomerase B